MNNRYSTTFKKCAARGWISGISLGLIVWLGVCLTLWSVPGWGSEMVLQLSGDVEYPGVLSLKKEKNEIQRLCFVGVQGKGKVDRGFIRKIAQIGIPSGDYRVTGPLTQENWPIGTFLKNGALRLQPVTRIAQDRVQNLGRKGVAIHGRDFYPIVMPMAEKKELIDFYNDLLFDRLTRYWGALRVTNWDMDRLYDFWARNTESPDEWQVQVRSITTETIYKLCKPPVVKRKPD